MLTPALAMLKAWRPDLILSVLVESAFLPLLAGNPDVDEILTLDSRRLVAGGTLKGTLQGWRRATAQLRLISEIRERSFALCLNLHGGPTSAWLTVLSGARHRAGFHHFRSTRLYHFLVPDARQILARQDVHTAELQVAALYWLGLPRGPIPPAKMAVSAASRDWWRANRSRLGLAPGQEYALIQPTALYATKRWAAEKFAEIGTRLEREAKLAVLYACGPGESAVLDAVEGAAAHPLRRLQSTGLGQYAAALSEARVFVGNDSGPAHMASALCRPSVVIFGSSSSLIWGPWPRPPSPEATSQARSGPSNLGSGSRAQPARIVQNSYECNPCPGDQCYRFERPECILSIGVAQVWDAVKAVLSDSP